MKQRYRRHAVPPYATATSSLVRRLINARNDPAKERIRDWLSAICDAKLLSFGLSVDDIRRLRHAALQTPVMTGKRHHLKVRAGRSSSSRAKRSEHCFG